MDWRSWDVLLAGIACFGSFAWAARFHFGKDGDTPTGMKILSVVNLAAFSWFIYGISSWPEGYRLAPFGLCVLSLLLFWWCVEHTRRKRLTLAFSPDVPAFLETSGPYRLVRHPFYLAYLLFWVATALAIPHLIAWAVPALMAVIYTIAAAREETKFSNSALEEQYRKYRAETGMFMSFPARRSRKHSIWL